MKKLILTLFALPLFLSVHAQDNLQGGLYVGFGTSVWSHFGINDIIKSNGGSPFHLFSPNVEFGILLEYKNAQINFGGNLGFAKKKEDIMPYKFNYGSIKLGLRYKVLTITNRFLYAGLAMDYVPYSLILYPVNSSLDFNNIISSKINGQVQLYNRSFLIGPTIATGNLFPNASIFNLRITASYEFNVSHSQWQSKYVQLNNAPKEEGNRFRVGIIMPLTDND